MLRETCLKAFEKRDALAKTTTALRLINGKGDGINGLTVDKYNNHFVLQIFNPRARETADDVVKIIQEKFSPTFLVVKDRTSADSRSLDNPQADVRIQTESPKTVVEENGLKFEVNLNDTVNTGLFLDMRRNRQVVGALCEGKEVLNCFAYTCSFGVYARRSKAARVVNVDISPKVLEKGMKNYQLNGIQPDKTEFMRAESLKYLERGVKKNNFFDVIILDPPSFARYEGKVFAVKRDMRQLVGLAVPILKPHGHLFVSTNFNELGSVQLTEFVMQEAAQHKRTIKNITPLGQDEDFPGSGMMKESYLAALLVDLVG